MTCREFEKERRGGCVETQPPLRRLVFSFLKQMKFESEQKGPTCEARVPKG
jgi:hypothetical protein